MLWITPVIAIVAAACAGLALGTLDAELFPTEVRGTSSGFLLVSAVAGSAVGLVLATQLKDVVGGLGPAIALCGIASLIAAIFVVPRLPETADAVSTTSARRRCERARPDRARRLRTLASRTTARRRRVPCRQRLGRDRHPEIPGLHPEVVAFGRASSMPGSTVYMPSLFGTLGKPMTNGCTLAVTARCCVAKAFTTMALGRASPIIGGAGAALRRGVRRVELRRGPRRSTC